VPRRPGARVNHDPRLGVSVQGLTTARPENLLAPPAETRRQCRYRTHKNLRQVAQQPAELAGNRRESARGKKSLAKDGKVGENEFTRLRNLRPHTGMHGPLSAGFANSGL